MATREELENNVEIAKKSIADTETGLPVIIAAVGFVAMMMNPGSIFGVLGFGALMVGIAMFLSRHSGQAKAQADLMNAQQRLERFMDKE